MKFNQRKRFYKTNHYAHQSRLADCHNHRSRRSNAEEVAAMAGLLTALPQTRLYQRLKNEGRLETEGTGNNTQAELNLQGPLNPNSEVKAERSSTQGSARRWRAVFGGSAKTSFHKLFPLEGGAKLD